MVIRGREHVKTSSPQDRIPEPKQFRIAANRDDFIVSWGHLAFGGFFRDLSADGTPRAMFASAM